MRNTKKTMLRSATCRSFIPYLQTHHSQGPKIKLAVRDPSPGDQTIPFRFLESSGSLAVILSATLYLDGRHAGTDFFLLLQPDNYSAASSELRPLTNPEVEQLWEDTLNRYRTGSDAPGQVIPMSPWDETRGWVPFQPILYCSRKDQYCPTLCPLCGMELDLCRDDKALVDAGLQPFSTSPQRYLYCPGCHRESVTSIFYTRVLPGDHGDNLRDCRGLVADYNKLLSRSDLAEELPCIGCEHCGDCFGPANLVSDRMVPLNFFPFHALLQPAPTLNLLDFIPLLGGLEGRWPTQPAWVKCESGRQQCLERFQETYGRERGFLFQGDGRHFLEVLYLKLTLLHALFEAGIGTPALLREPVGRMSLEGFWVHLGNQSRRLPYLWGFDLRLVDTVGWPQENDSNSQMARSQARHFMGNAWFYILLCNARQDFNLVQAALSILIEKDAAADLELPISDDPADPLGPGNIFWSESPIAIDPRWNVLWQQSLNLGLSLLRAGLNADATWSDQEFDTLLSELRTAVRHELFQASPAAKVQETKSGSDQRIAAIVGAILQKWPAVASKEVHAPESEPVLSEETAPQAGEDGDIEETIILGSQDTLPGMLPQEGDAAAGRMEINRTSFPPPGEDGERTVVISPPAAPSGEFDPDQTLIIGGSVPSANDQEQTPVSRAPVQPLEEALDRTVVISPAPSVPVYAADPEQTVMIRPPVQGAGEDLDKTVVISPLSSIPVTGKDTDQTLVSRPPVHPPVEDPERTVVISPPPLPAGGSDLEETVLMGGHAPSSTDDPDRTIIISRQSREGEPERKSEKSARPGQAGASKAPPDDDLEATVIMDPGRNKK
jgi:hypothetical protein